jgi:hypothetical protein
MTTIKALTLAAVAALTFGAGSAMAQTESLDPTPGVASQWNSNYRAPAPATYNQAPQAGSSDTNLTPPANAPGSEWRYGDLPG